MILERWLALFRVFKSIYFVRCRVSEETFASGTAMSRNGGLEGVRSVPRWPFVAAETKIRAHTKTREYRKKKERRYAGMRFLVELLALFSNYFSSLEITPTPKNGPRASPSSTSRLAPRFFRVKVRRFALIDSRFLAFAASAISSLFGRRD